MHTMSNCHSCGEYVSVGAFDWTIPPLVKIAVVGGAVWYFFFRKPSRKGIGGLL